MRRPSAKSLIFCAIVAIILLGFVLTVKGEEIKTHAVEINHKGTVVELMVPACVPNFGTWPNQQASFSKEVCMVDWFGDNGLVSMLIYRSYPTLILLEYGIKGEGRKWWKYIDGVPVLCSMEEAAEITVEFIRKADKIKSM